MPTATATAPTNLGPLLKKDIQFLLRRWALISGSFCLRRTERISPQITPMTNSAAAK